MKKGLIHFIIVAVILLSGSLADARLKCSSTVPAKKTVLKQATSGHATLTVMPQVLLFGV